MQVFSSSLQCVGTPASSPVRSSSATLLEKLPVRVYFKNLYMDLTCKAIVTWSLILFNDNKVNFVSSHICAVPACCHCISSYLKINGFAFVMEGDTLGFLLSIFAWFQTHLNTLTDR